MTNQSIKYDGDITTVEGRENLFRLASPAKHTGWFIAAIVLGGLLLLTRSVVGVLIAVVFIGIGVWGLWATHQGSLSAADPNQYQGMVRSRRQAVAAYGMEQMRLNPTADVLQSVTIFGGTYRHPIEGRRRSLFGIRPDPTVGWRPRAPHPDLSVFLYGAYHYHALFALEDAIAFYSVRYDIILDNWMEQGSSNRIYYRFIENVRLEPDRFIIETVGGRSHEFGLWLPLDVEYSPDVQETGLATPPRTHLDSAMWNEGSQFVNTVNQLRDEWERRQRPH